MEKTARTGRQAGRPAQGGEKEGGGGKEEEEAAGTAEALLAVRAAQRGPEVSEQQFCSHLSRAKDLPAESLANHSSLHKKTCDPYG